MPGKPVQSIFAFLLWWSIVGAAFGATAPVPPTPRPTAVVSFTDEVTGTGLPGRIEERTTLAARQLYVLTRFENLPTGRHWYRCEIYDGSGKRVLLGGLTLDVESSGYWTSTPFSPNRFDDAPGTWKAVVFLDGVEVARQTLQVDPVPPVTRPLSVGAGLESFTKSIRLGGGSYVYAGAEWEWAPGLSSGLRWSTQLVPDSFADELLTFSTSVLVSGRNNIYSGYGILYSNSARHLDKGLLGLELDLVDSGDSSSPRFSLFPFRLEYDLEHSQILVSFEILRFQFKI